MGLEIFQVDAFTDKRFAGNPAAVCVLPEAADEDSDEAASDGAPGSESADE